VWWCLLIPVWVAVDGRRLGFRATKHLFVQYLAKSGPQILMYNTHLSYVYITSILRKPHSLNMYNPELDGVKYINVIYPN
jgi:hypothetical protein